MNLTIDFSDPVVVKAGAGLALYALCGSRLCKTAGIALGAWAAWEYFNRPATAAATAPAALKQNGQPDAAGRLPGELFYGWPTNYTPSVRPRRPGETTGARPGDGAKVLPFPGPGEEQATTLSGLEDDGG